MKDVIKTVYLVLRKEVHHSSLHQNQNFRFLEIPSNWRKYYCYLSLRFYRVSHGCHCFRVDAYFVFTHKLCMGPYLITHNIQIKLAIPKNIRKTDVPLSISVMLALYFIQCCDLYKTKCIISRGAMTDSTCLKLIQQVGPHRMGSEKSS